MTTIIAVSDGRYTLETIAFLLLSSMSRITHLITAGSYVARLAFFINSLLH